MSRRPEPVGGDALKAFRQTLARARKAEAKARELRARVIELEYQQGNE